MHQFRQYVILTLVLLGCAACVFFGIRQMVSTSDTDFAVGEWSRIDVPLYEGPATYRAASSRGGTMSVPMVSSNARSLFHHSMGSVSGDQGSVTYRSSFSGPSYQTVYQTSNSTVHSIGGGGWSERNQTASNGYESNGYSGGGTSGGYGTSSVGINISGVRTDAYDTRVYAYNTIGVARGSLAQAPIVTDAASAASSSRSAKPGIRRAQPDDDEGEEGLVLQDTEDPNIWWYYGEDGWTTDIPNGARVIINGNAYVWNGSWIPDMNGPDQPIGDLPWILLLLMTTGYAVCRKLKTKKITIKK